MDPWQAAVQQFKSTLNEKETELFVKATAEEILNEVVKIEQNQRKSSNLRRWSDRIRPLLDVIDDYGRAFDVLANAASVLPPLWGSLRVLLITAQKHNDYYSKLVDMLERIGDLLPRYGTYVKLLSFHKPLQQGLQDIYLEIIRFSFRAKCHLTKSPIFTALELTMRSFDNIFVDSISQLRRYKEFVEEEAKLASIILQVQETTKAEEERKRADSNRRRVERLEAIAEYRSKEEAKDWLNGRKCHQERALLEQNRLVGTCDWILKHEEFTRWTKDPKTQMLWIHGPPGCGKSFLYSKMLNHLELGKPSPYFLFCGSDKERVTFQSLIRSWALQLVEHYDEALTCLLTIKDIQQNPTATEQEVTELLRQTLEIVPGCYLTVDAIDECTSFRRRSEFFKSIAFIPERIKILITSRTPANMNDLPMIPTPLKSLEVLPEYSKNDLDHFIDQSINDADFTKDEKIVDAIRSRLGRCNGMFLWVKLMVEHLQLQTCEYEMLECLEELPEGLPQTYDRIMERMNQLPKNQRTLALKVLFWVITARRPISVSEVKVLLAVQPKVRYFDERRIISDADSAILAVCGGLVSFRGLDKKIHCTHFTVAEYLEQYLQRREILQEVLACYDVQELKSKESLAAAVCLRYLCYSFIGLLQPPQSPCGAEELISGRDPRLALLSYASSSWFVHTKSLDSPDTLVTKLGLQFLDETNPNLELWWHLNWFSSSSRWKIETCLSNISSHYVATYLGISHLIEAPLSHQPLSLVDSEQRTPFWRAASGGHSIMTRTPIEAACNHDSPDSFSSTPAT